MKRVMRRIVFKYISLGDEHLINKSKMQMKKEKINLPLNPNSKSANINKIQFRSNENIHSIIQKIDEKKHFSLEKINGDPKLNNQPKDLNIHSNKKFMDMKKKFLGLWENGDEK